MLNEILIPYIERKQKDLNIQNKPWLLICDVFKGQWTDTAKDAVKKSNGKMVPVPNNCTTYFQPLDLTVIKSSKHFVCQVAQSWYSQKIFKRMEMGKRSNEIKVDVYVPVVKSLHMKWIVKFYDYVNGDPQVSGIMNKLNQ